MGRGPPEGGGKWRRREGRGEEDRGGVGEMEWKGRERATPERKSYSYGLGTRPVTAC